MLGFVLALALGSAGLLGGGRALGSSTTITVIGGSVSVRHGAAGTFVAAVDGEVLNAGDAVRTADASRAVLTYFEGSTVTIEPNTELAIDAAAANGSDTIVEMTQTIGRTWHVVTKVVTGGSKYEVRTPASTASVRGTAFTVDTDGTTTTITTTEGTVVDAVPDPNDPTRTIDVPVPAGQRHSQTHGTPPRAIEPAPEPEREVTITVSDENSIVIDTLGRANGIDKNGKAHLETPGAKLTKVDGKLVITLPNIPDGRLQALSHSQGNVDVQTTVQQHGQSPVTTTGTATADANGQAHAAVDIGTGTNGNANVQQAQTPSPSPSASASASASATPTTTDADSGSGGTSSGGPSGPGNGNGQGSGSGNGNGNGNGNGGQGGRPTPTSGGFVPPSALPTLPVATATATPAPSPTRGNGNGGGGSGGGAGGNPQPSKVPGRP